MNSGVGRPLWGLEYIEIYHWKMKYIIKNWDYEKSQYKTRIASEEEVKTINQALEMFRECKETYYQIIDEAERTYPERLDLFIDNEAFNIVKELNVKLDLVKDMTEGLIDLDVRKYQFILW